MLRKSDAAKLRVTEFTKQMVMEQAEKLNIPVNTARSWIQRLREKGALDMMMVKGKGVYSKKQR